MCSVTAAVWPHTVSLLLHRSSRVMTAATGSAKGAQALLRPRVNNNPSAFTNPPPLGNQQHCVTRQITSQRPPTPAQTLYVLALVVPQLPPTKPPLDPICQVETGCEKWLCFSAEPRGSEPELIAVYLTINKTDHQSQQDALQTSN